MTEADVRYSIELLDGLATLSDIRDGFKKGDANWLKMVAFEGDDSGGSHHASALISLQIWPEIIDFTESLVRRELARLGIHPNAQSPQDQP